MKSAFIPDVQTVIANSIDSIVKCQLNFVRNGVRHIAHEKNNKRGVS
jgi:hypothetical protein